MAPKRCPAIPTGAHVAMAVRIGEIAWLAPQVVALRLARLARAGPAARRRETSRMISEKYDALLEIAIRTSTTATHSFGTAAPRTVATVHRRVVANHRRLRRH